MNALNRILTAVSHETGIPIAAIRGPGRTQAVGRARWMVMLLLPWYWSLSEVAASIGRTCHGTVMHGRRQGRELCRTDSDFLASILRIRQNLTETKP